MADFFEQLSSLRPFGTHLAFGAILGIAIYKTTKWADEFFPKHVRVALSQWLLGLSPAIEISEWTTRFIDMFKGFLGERAFSKKRIRRSTLLSLLFMLAIGLTLNLEPTIQALLGEDVDADFALVILCFGFVANLFIDWCVLIPTSWILERVNSMTLLPRSRASVQIAFAVFVDTYAKYMLVGCVGTAAYWTIAGVLSLA